jgi:predicted Zn-dependent peptidase
MRTRVLLLVVLLVGAAAPLAAQEPPGVVSERLDNGLLVTILRDPALPVVATNIWYHVGSANEAPGTRGFSHLFEHLMFGDTTTVSREEYARHHTAHGGYENAYTAFDETVYISTIAPEHHDRVLWLEADRMVHLVLSPENLANEQRIVTEELRYRLQNDPFSRVLVAALAGVMGDHPYAWTPAGTEEDIAAAELERARAFYARFYRPDNAHLVIAGPVEIEEKLETVRSLFGPIPGGGETPPPPPALVEHDFPAEVVELEEDLPPVETALLVYALPPPADAPEHWALLVLQQMLGGGAVDPLDEELVQRRNKAVYAGTEWYAMRRGGALLFTAAYLPYRRQKTAFRLLDETVDTLAGLEWLTDESLAAAQRTLVRRRTNDVYYASELANRLGEARWWLGDAALALEAPERIRAVTREQVAEVFRRYVADADPARLYIRPERVPLWVRLFGWLYPLANR